MVQNINKATLGITVFLLLVLIFDGLRQLAKIPGGVLPYREYKIMDSTSSTEVLALTSYLGHRDITFAINDESAFTSGFDRVGGAVTDVAVDLTASKEHVQNAFLDRSQANDAYNLDGDLCLTYGKHIYNIEWAIFGIVMFPILVLLGVLIGFVKSTAGTITTKRGQTVTSTTSGNATVQKRQITSVVFKLVVIMFISYLILKMSRFGLERRAFMRHNECVNQAFNDRGVHLLENYVNLDHLIDLTTHPKANLVVETSAPMYNAMFHLVLMDGLHVGLVLLFAVLQMFNENLYSISPMGGLMKTGMGSYVTMGPMTDMAQTEQLQNLLTA